MIGSNLYWGMMAVFFFGLSWVELYLRGHDVNTFVILAFLMLIMGNQYKILMKLKEVSKKE